MMQFRTIRTYLLIPAFRLSSLYLRAQEEPAEEEVEKKGFNKKTTSHQLTHRPQAKQQ